MELNTVRGWRFLKSLLSLTLPGRPLSCCPPFPPSQSFGQEPATSLRQIFPRLPKGYFTKIPIRSLPITNVPNHLQENLFTLCASGFLWQPPPPFIQLLYLLPLGYFCLSQPLFHLQRWWGLMALLQKKNHKYDATLLSFRSDKYTVAEHQKGGGGGSMVSLTNCYDL